MEDFEQIRSSRSLSCQVDQSLQDEMSCMTPRIPSSAGTGVSPRKWTEVGVVEESREEKSQMEACRKQHGDQPSL